MTDLLSFVLKLKIFMISGMATVTRSDDFFDCHPAIQSAFKFTKMVTKGPSVISHEGIQNAEKVLDNYLEFDEFKIFLNILRQYYVYCQVRVALIMGLRRGAELQIYVISLIDSFIPSIKQLTCIIEH